MRVLASWDPQQLPKMHGARSIEEDAAFGMLPDTDAEDWFAASWDPSPDYVPPEGGDLVSNDFIRETFEGIQTCRHPEAILRDNPRLWDVVAMWRAGVEREISRDDYATLSNFEIECWLTMRAAHDREAIRQLERRRQEQREQREEQQQ